MHDPSTPSAPPGKDRTVEDRLVAIEAVVRTGEVCTRRLAVVDEDGQERIVGEVTGAHADLSVMIGGAVLGQHSAVSLSAGADPGLGADLGLHLYAEGDELVALSAWRDGTEPWQTALSGVAVRPVSGMPE